jgi:hypothetical protein
MSYSSSNNYGREEEESEELQSNKDPANNSNSNNVISVSSQMDYSNSALAVSDYQQLLTKRLSNSPQLRAIAESNASRTCPWCNVGIPGEISERSNPLRDHYRKGCKVRDEANKRREQTTAAVSSMDQSVRAIQDLATEQGRIYQEIKAQVWNIFDVNLTFGSDIPCLSAQEYDAKYDRGDKDTIVVATVSPNGSGRQERVLRCYSTDREGRLTYKSDQVTRLVDEALATIRAKHPQIWDHVIADLANEFPMKERGREKRKEEEEHQQEAVEAQITQQ